ncbi:Protein of unknown function [Gryllus bimaculatus]|nr:Protein of unknown function [Gryllus bimaculatus]
MARTAALLLVGALGAVLCAAIELQESTTVKDEEKDIKISSKESKELLEKLRFDLEPAISHGFPFPLALPVPWLENSSSESPKPTKTQTAEELGNDIPSKDIDINTNANANPDSKFEDLVKTANRMMIEEARRRRLFKKKMQTLLQSKLPTPASKKEVRALEKPAVAVEVEDAPEGREASMMSDAFRSFRRFAHAVPLMHHLASSRLSSPFAMLPGPFTLRSADPSAQDEAVDDGGDHAVLMVRGFSFEGSPPVVSRVQRINSERLPKLVPDDSMNIDVTFVPLQTNSRAIPRHSLSPLREIEVIPNVDPGMSFPALPLISRVLNVMSRVRQRFMEDMDAYGLNSSGQKAENRSKIDPLESFPSSQEVPSIPPQPASDSTANLKLAKDIQKNDTMLTSDPVGGPSEEAGKRSKRNVNSSSERQESPDEPAAPTSRMMAEEKAEPQQINSRMMMPEVSAIRGQPSPVGFGALPMGIPFYPTGYAPNMFVNNMKLPFWKQFYKAMPYSMSGVPLGFDKLAYQMKMYPKFPMAVGMAGAQRMGMAAPMTEQELAMANPPNTQGADEAQSAASADEADEGNMEAGVAQQARMLSRRVPCRPTCAPALMRATRSKRSVGGGGGAAVQQALDASAATSHGEAGGEQKTGRNKAPTIDVLRDKEPREEQKGRANSPWEQLSSSSQQNLSNRKTPQSAPLRVAPLLGTPHTPESEADQTRNSFSDLVFEGFENYPLQWKTQIPVEDSDAVVDHGFSGIEGVYREATPSSLKELQGMKSVKTRKKVPSRSELWEAALKPDQSAERWTAPSAAAFGAVPFFSPLSDSLLGEGEGEGAGAGAGEEVLLGDRSFLRPRRSLGAGEGGEQEGLRGEAAPTHAGHRSGQGGALRHAKAHGHGGRLRSKLKASPVAASSAVAGDGPEAAKREKRVRAEHMPFLDPTMTEDSRFDRYFRRDLGNDFEI